MPRGLPEVSRPPANWNLCSRGQIHPCQLQLHHRQYLQVRKEEEVARSSAQGIRGVRSGGRLSFVCRACLTALGCKSPSHPDGGEVIAKRQGIVVRRGLKAAGSKDASRWTRTGYEAYGAGRAGKGSRSPYPSRALVVNSAVAR